jgi:hypothetical protein
MFFEGHKFKNNDVLSAAHFLITSGSDADFLKQLFLPVFTA